MFSQNRESEHNQRKRVCFVEFAKVAAPEAKPAVSDCILFVLAIWRLQELRLSYNLHWIHKLLIWCWRAGVNCEGTVSSLRSPTVEEERWGQAGGCDHCFECSSLLWRCWFDNRKSVNNQKFSTGTSRWRKSRLSTWKRPPRRRYTGL